MSSDCDRIVVRGDPAPGEWRLYALALRARLPLEMLRDGIQPFPTFSEVSRRGTASPGGRHHYGPRACTLRRALRAASPASAAVSMDFQEVSIREREQVLGECSARDRDAAPLAFMGGER